MKPVTQSEIIGAALKRIEDVICDALAEQQRVLNAYGRVPHRECRNAGECPEYPDFGSWCGHCAAAYQTAYEDERAVPS